MILFLVSIKSTLFSPAFSLEGSSSIQSLFSYSPWNPFRAGIQRELARDTTSPKGPAAVWGTIPPGLCEARCQVQLLLLPPPCLCLIPWFILSWNPQFLRVASATYSKQLHLTAVAPRLPPPPPRLSMFFSQAPRAPARKVHFLYEAPFHDVTLFWPCVSCQFFTHLMKGFGGTWIESMRSFFVLNISKQHWSVQWVQIHGYFPACCSLLPSIKSLWNASCYLQLMKNVTLFS